MRFIRLLIAYLAVMVVIAHVHAGQPVENFASPLLTPILQKSGIQSDINLKPIEPVLAQRCCKICRKGKACGNSCIARWKNCTKPPGCACDAK